MFFLKYFWPFSYNLVSRLRARAILRSPTHQSWRIQNVDEHAQNKFRFYTRKFVSMFVICGLKKLEALWITIESMEVLRCHAPSATLSSSKTKSYMPKIKQLHVSTHTEVYFLKYTFMRSWYKEENFALLAVTPSLCAICTFSSHSFSSKSKCKNLLHKKS